MPFVLPEGRPAVMGVLNVTPDSFSDGGDYVDPQAAIARGLQMMEEGADLVDVGGESTRPGAEAVAADIEAQRVVPVIEGLANQGVPVSIDTSKAEVARRALEAGAQVVNDVTALADPDMPVLCAKAGCTVCLMHMQGDPRTMQQAPTYGDVVSEVCEWLLDAAAKAQEAGVASENIWLDPGIGFGKTVEHNLQLLAGLGELVVCGYPVLVGVSRKSFIGRVLGSESGPLPVDQRLEGTLAAQVLAQAFGARIVRTHDVQSAVRAAKIAGAILAVD